VRRIPVDSGTGEDAMNTDQTHTNKDLPAHAAPHERDKPDSMTRAEPHRMPAGGWIREIATSENWRTTTIVQRHRDRASPVSSS